MSVATILPTTIPMMIIGWVIQPASKAAYGPNCNRGVMGATDGDDFSFDKVSVIPEPGVAALAGWGGMLLLEARRH